MFPKELQVLNQQLSTTRLSMMLGLLALCLQSGCHRRAYNDLYADTMAAEIRDLEDQLYQYDHEYRLLEQELESLRRRKLESPGLTPVTPTPIAPLEFVPADRKQPAGPPSKPSETGSAAPKSIPKQAPNNSSGAEEIEASPPSILNKNQPFQFPAQPTNNLPAPKEDARPAQPTNTNQKSSGTDLEFNAGDLIVPTITSSAMTPPTLDVSGRSATPDKDLELSLSQIEMPSQLTVGRSDRAKITTAVQVVTDKRIVELAFHPALSRAVNFDDDNQDDGLFLVLQPKNEQGQVVNLPGAITIEVVDPSRENANSTIGRWTYSASEVEGKIQPLGSKQGIHFTLPWNGPNPKADRVQVTVTMQLDNGRKVVGKREIFLNSGGGFKTVWTPRANRSEASRSDSTRPSVVPASAEETPTNSGHSVQSVGSYPAPENAPMPVFQR